VYLYLTFYRVEVDSRLTRHVTVELNGHVYIYRQTRQRHADLLTSRRATRENTFCDSYRKRALLAVVCGHLRFLFGSANAPCLLGERLQLMTGLNS
jgi:hypothetical protein